MILGNPYHHFLPGTDEDTEAWSRETARSGAKRLGQEAGSIPSSSAAAVLSKPPPCDCRGKTHEEMETQNILEYFTEDKQN